MDLQVDACKSLAFSLLRSFTFRSLANDDWVLERTILFGLLYYYFTISLHCYLTRYDYIATMLLYHYSMTILVYYQISIFTTVVYLKVKVFENMQTASLGV